MSENEENTVTEEKSCDNENESAEEGEHDPHFEPVISLPQVEVPTLEEDETVMLSLRAKLYRYDANESPPEWKERGTGTVKMLRHKFNDTVRVVMRRDKTLKLCANHFITSHMVLQPSASCDRAWVYSVKDFSDATIKTEVLAIKFANINSAQKWKDMFEEAKKIVALNENSKGDALSEDKILIGDPPKLSDTFEEDKKCSFSERKEDNEKGSPKILQNSDLNKKLSSMTIQS